jgi:phosphopantothenoylcysteine decarboxylase / phosphopantothenate---cysteine ligase
VRVLTNRSSGKQGYALAQAALEMGAQVTLISAPTALTPPVGVAFVRVETVQEMLESVIAASANADALVMAAAVSDFRVKAVAANKLKKRDGVPAVELTAAPDILEAVSRLRGESSFPRVLVGFAAESQNLLENAQAKLTSKNLDMIVANDISAQDAGFAVDDNRVTLLFADGHSEALALMPKDAVAELVMAHVAQFLE